MNRIVAQDQTALALDHATLPVIDLSGLLAGREGDVAAVAARLGEAARSSGFFYVTGHGVDPELIEAMFAASREFHGKSRSFKMRWWSGFTTHHRGYVPFEENGADFPAKINFNEAWDLSFEAPPDHPDHLAGWRMTGPNVWPDIEGWRETVSAYYDAVFALGLRLLDALALELGVDPAELRRHITAPNVAAPHAALRRERHAGHQGDDRHRRALGLRVLHDPAPGGPGPAGHERRRRLDRGAADPRGVHRQHRRHLRGVVGRALQGPRSTAS